MGWCCWRPRPPEHVLLGILDEGDNVAIRPLEDLQVDRDELRDELRASMPPPAGAAPPGHVPFTPPAKRALELAAKEALALGHGSIGCEHLLRHSRLSGPGPGRPQA